MLRAAGAEPLVPYTNIKAKWKSRCLNPACRREVEPCLDSIKHAKTAACCYCGGYGIKAHDDALVYLVVNEKYGAVKVGIGKARGRRIEQHESDGWVQIRVEYMKGAEARAVESRVLRGWSALGLPYGVRPANMPNGGYTETVSLEARPLHMTEADLEEALRAELN